MKAPAAPAQAEWARHADPVRSATPLTAGRGERLVNQRGAALAQRQLDERVQRAPRVVQQRQLAHSIDTSPRMVLQAAGFKAVNNAPASKDDPVTGAFAKAGEDVWGAVFTDTKIDDEGGIVGEYAPGDAALNGDATTRHEADEPLYQNAFALVTVSGRSPDTTERWSQAIVVNDKELAIPPLFFATNGDALRAQLLLQLGSKPQPGVANNGLKDFCLDLEMDDCNTVEAWCTTNGGAPDWLPAALLVAAEGAAAKYGKLPDEGLADFMGCDKLTALSLAFFAHLKQAYPLAATSSTKYVKGNAQQTMPDIVMHEFGHVNAGLQVTPEAVQGALDPLRPNKASPLNIVAELEGMTNDTATMNRNRVTALRFAWAKVVTAGAMQQAVVENPALKNAIAAMPLLLLSFEEFFNIQAIDNTLVRDTTPATHKRLSHGVENQAAFKIGGEMTGVDGLVASKASSTPDDMAKAVWVARLKQLVGIFRLKCDAL